MAEPKDNIVVLGGNASIPLLKRYLPEDILLETDIDDFWLRDIAPVREVMFKFVRKTNDYGANQQKKMKRFIARCTRQKFLYESPLVADGGNIIHNDVDKAILTSKVYEENSYFTKKQIVSTLRQELSVNKVTIIPRAISGEPSGHADLSMSFIDKNVIAYSDLTGTGQIRSLLEREFRSTARLVKLDSVVFRESLETDYTACGLHVNILSTEKYLYVPVFSGDFENRRRGQTVARDWANVRLIAANTGKTVVPVTVPYRICVLGGNTRCLAWDLKGPMADDLVYAAQLGRCPRNTG